MLFLSGGRQGIDEATKLAVVILCLPIIVVSPPNFDELFWFVRRSKELLSQREWDEPVCRPMTLKKGAIVSLDPRCGV